MGIYKTLSPITFLRTSQMGQGSFNEVQTNGNVFFDILVKKSRHFFCQWLLFFYVEKLLQLSKNQHTPQPKIKISPCHRYIHTNRSLTPITMATGIISFNCPISSLSGACAWPLQKLPHFREMETSQTRTTRWCRWQSYCRPNVACKISTDTQLHSRLHR